MHDVAVKSLRKAVFNLLETAKEHEERARGYQKSADSLRVNAATYRAKADTLRASITALGGDPDEEQSSWQT